MTKYKEYLRSKGIKLMCDYEALPYKNLEAVKTSVTDGCVMRAAAHQLYCLLLQYRCTTRIQKSKQRLST